MVIKLKLHEFYNLDIELNGFVNPSTGEKLSNGLLDERLKLTTKYWLTELSNKIQVEKSILDSLKEELIKKYGETDENGVYGIKTFSVIENDEEVVNPKFIEFQNEFTSLLKEEKELEYKPIPLSSFDNITSSDNYPTLFKLVVEDEQN